jgi:hypothetical protein
MDQHLDNDEPSASTLDAAGNVSMISSKAPKPPRGREITTEIGGRDLDLGAYSGPEFRKALEYFLERGNGGSAGEQAISDEEAARLLALHQLQSADLDELKQRFLTVEKIALGVLSGETTAGRTIAGDYVFEKRIRDELLLHPREYTHLSSEAFR